MRTTVELPDDLFRRIKARAAMDGITLKELLTRFVERGLRQTGGHPLPERRRSEPPVARPRRGVALPVSSNEEIHALLEEDDWKGAAR